MMPDTYLNTFRCPGCGVVSVPYIHPILRVAICEHCRHKFTMIEWGTQVGKQGYRLEGLEWGLIPNE